MGLIDLFTMIHSPLICSPWIRSSVIRFLLICSVTFDPFIIDAFSCDPTVFSAWNGAGAVPVLHNFFGVGTVPVLFSAGARSREQGAGSTSTFTILCYVVGLFSIALFGLLDADHFVCLMTSFSFDHP